MPRKLVGRCDYCDRDYVLTKKRRIRKHKADPREFGAEARLHVCRGSGTTPQAMRIVMEMPKSSWQW